MNAITWTQVVKYVKAHSDDTKFVTNSEIAQALNSRLPDVSCLTRLAADAGEIFVKKNEIVDGTKGRAQNQYYARNPDVPKPVYREVDWNEVFQYLKSLKFGSYLYASEAKLCEKFGYAPGSVYSAWIKKSDPRIEFSLERGIQKRTLAQRRQWKAHGAVMFDEVLDHINALNGDNTTTRQVSRMTKLRFETVVAIMNRLTEQGKILRSEFIKGKPYLYRSRLTEKA